MKANSSKSLRSHAPDGNKPRRQHKIPASNLIKPAGAQSKLAHVVAMLHAGDGAGIEQIMRATGWQRHTVRGVISGAIKKKLGLEVTSETRDGKRIYRIAARSVRGHTK